jgi:hypothetical protein
MVKKTKQSRQGRVGDRASYRASAGRSPKVGTGTDDTPGRRRKDAAAVTAAVPPVREFTGSNLAPPVMTGGGTGTDDTP